MYSRSYYPENEGIKIPENYDGNAFREKEIKEEEKAVSNEGSPGGDGVLRAPWDVTERTEEVMSKADADRHGFGGIFDKLSLNNLTGFLPFFKGGKFSLGHEEILILAIAAFLLFSHGGDKECAIMLLLLLWIK